MAANVLTLADERQARGETIAGAEPVRGSRRGGRADGGAFPPASSVDRQIGR